MAVFIALILAPLGLPLPEDLTLLLAGALVGQGHANAISTFFVGYVGILCADSIAWTYGRRFGLHPTGFISRLVGPSDVERIERFYRRWGAWTIVIARMVPGTRIPAFFFAGASGISWLRFILVDAAAAWLPVVVFCGLGWRFSENIQDILSWVEHLRTFGLALGIGLVAFVIWRVVKRRREAASASAAASVATAGVDPSPPSAP